MKPQTDFLKKEKDPSNWKFLTKNLATEYLLNTYTNDQNQLNCQICNKEMPFKLDNGNYYFEKVKFLDFNKDHHQNYLALCANHSSMFMYTLKDNDKNIREKIKFADISGKGPFSILITIGQTEKNYSFLQSIYLIFSKF